MATNNFLPWGDNAGNIMDGADYEASTQRTDGVELGLADPALHNRLYRQVTLMAAALGQVIADNGLDATDSNMAGLVQAIKQVFLAVTPISRGGTGAADALGAAISLGLSDPDEMDFAATDAEDWENQVKAHILERIQNRRCMMFTAGWSGRGFGSGLAWKAARNVYALIFNQEATQTLKFWFYMATDQSWRDISIG